MRGRADNESVDCLSVDDAFCLRYEQSRKLDFASQRPGHCELRPILKSKVEKSTFSLYLAPKSNWLKKIQKIKQNRVL